MATAKTPKTAPVKPAADAPAVAVKAAVAKPVAPKPVVAKPVAAKPAAVVKAVEEVAKPAEKVAVQSAVTLEEVTASATMAIEAAAKEVAAEPPEPVKAPVKEVAAETPEPVKAPVKEVAAKVAVASNKTEEKILTGVETFLEFGRDNAILLVSAGNDVALGFHKLSLSLIDWSAETCDKSVAGASALMSAKTVEEAIDLSQSLVKDGFEHLLKEGSELGSLSTKLLEETLVPLTGRLVAAVEKLASHAA